MKQYKNKFDKWWIEHSPPIEDDNEEYSYIENNFNFFAERRGQHQKIRSIKIER